MYRASFCFAFHVLLAVAPARAQTQPADASLPWQVIADCAAAYQVNWQNRLSGLNRSPDMSNMIQAQSEDYKVTAIRYYQNEMKASQEGAKERVGSYITANVHRYIAMDKAEKLEDFLEKCPQLDPEPPA